MPRYSKEDLTNCIEHLAVVLSCPPLLEASLYFLYIVKPFTSERINERVSEASVW